MYFQKISEDDEVKHSMYCFFYGFRLRIYQNDSQIITFCSILQRPNFLGIRFFVIVRIVQTK